jgi:hypothetical protein
MAHVSALLPFNPSDEQKLVVIIFWEGPGAWLVAPLALDLFAAKMELISNQWLKSASYSRDASLLVTQMCHVFLVVERVPSTTPGE